MRYHDIQLTGSLQITGSLTLPAGTTEERPTNPRSGSVRLNTTLGVMEIYTAASGSEWVTVGEQTTPPPDTSRDIEYLVVAGGGGAGFDLTAGGGAGGLLSSSLSSMESGSNITVTVGAGGAGYTTGGVTSTADGTASSITSATGTSFTTVSTVGGGGGSRIATTPGRDGGSGGGCGRGNQGVTNPGSGTVGQGNDGGADTDSPAGTGGGGAGAAGGTASGTGNPSTGGNGGDGKQSSITGTSTYYAGGGGGGGYYGSAGTGGSGGGGNGSGGNAQNNQESGDANTGGGGGGGGQNSTAAASGGSGVAIFAYDSRSFNAVGGIVGDAGNSRKYHQFNSSGTFKVGSTSDLQIVTNNLQLHLDAGNFASRGTSTWTDLSGNGNNGTVTGATLGSNFFYTFDGSNDYITLPESAPANTSPHTVYGTFTGASETNWTLECWFKTSENDTDTWGTPIIGRDVGDLFAQLIVRNNYVQYMHADPSWQYVSSTSTVTDDNWHHVVLVNYSNATMDLWLDGTKEATGVDSTINYTDTRYFKLTQVARGYNGDYTACEVAQIRLYDNNLSASEIAQNYNATKTNFV